MGERRNERLGELIGRLANGDASALREIAFLMEGILRSIGNIYDQNEADVEERLEGLYLLLYKRAVDFRGGDNAFVWIIDLFVRSLEAEVAERKIESNEGTMSESYRFLRGIFDRLTREERALFVYHFWAKCTVRELAELTGESEAEIQNKLERLEEKIKKF